MASFDLFNCYGILKSLNSLDYLIQSIMIFHSGFENCFNTMAYNQINVFFMVIKYLLLNGSYRFIKYYYLTNHKSFILNNFSLAVF